MLMQILAMIACLLAAVLHLAVHRSPDIVDTHLKRMSRRIVMVAMLLAAMYTANCLYMAVPGNAVFLILLLLGMSQGIYAASDLLPHLEREHLWSSHLNSSR